MYNECYRLRKLSFEIVVVGLRDADLHKVAYWQWFITLNDYLIIYFHTVKLSTTEVASCFLFVDKHLEGLSNFRLVLLIGNLLLYLHDLLGAGSLLSRGYIIC